MNVFHFGIGERRLFGIYSPGRTNGRGARAALLCAPWGQEYLRAHSSLRQLGNQLTLAGFHVMRFDYYGTGDSAGEMADATVEGWEDDIGQALDELRDTSGIARVSLVGLRLGATLAARVAANRARDVSDLVLWDPIVSGSAYIKELRAAAAAATRRAQRSRDFEVNGFLLTRTLEEEVAALDLYPLTDRLPARTLALISNARCASESVTQTFLSALAGRDGRVVEVLEAPPAWVEYRNSGAAVTPGAILHRIARWLT